MGPVQVAHFNPVRLRVRPVELLGQPITGEAVRGREARDDDILAVAGAVHPGALDGVERHVRPVHGGLGEVEVKRRRVVQPVDDDGRVVRRHGAAPAIHQPDVPPVREQQ